MDPILRLAAENRQRALRLIEELQLFEAWRSAGAAPHLVGSLRSGLLMKHLDIDLHVYSPAPLRIEESFAAVARIARHPGIREIEYANRLDAEDNCLEWHVQYADERGALWQIDMIHLPEGSPWEGHFERVADRIAAALTDEMRHAILQLKYETPDTEKVPGIAYYMAVLRDGVRTFSEFSAWRRTHPLTGIVAWMP
ncbi:nucleotidyltransferase domain-containing protein [Alistipes sp.]|uniref:nucleotidyltransferase domain-containing protein n=1 Tax=Alistipes sp. TaxID=1872444 RepID=UPI0025BE26FD|nr:nucleotidyltransferase domain-containing protein [Alistipes sp.]MCI7141345.1 nucleotidyltransferase domain-containing protein [Alistipes sp.]MDY5397228.1 nucleotidyltransferase domain-containing protein [Alistipes sp.]